MKIRNGFVSNSSSSSFIVYYNDLLNSNNLSDEDIQKLKDFGFYKTYGFYPDNSEDDSKLIIDTDVNYNYGYYTTCNENIPLEFLLNNNISFIADCHYGQYTLVYNKNSDFVTVCCNLGKLYLMQGKYINVDHFKNRKCFEEIPKDKLIKEGYYI